jgi:hypothetical protein
MKKVIRRLNRVAIGLTVAAAMLLPQFSASAAASLGARRQSEVVALTSQQTVSQEVIARVVAGGQQQSEQVAASGASVLASPASNYLFIQATPAQVDKLRSEGWSVTLLFIRDEKGNWQAADGAFADCFYTLSPTSESFTASGGTDFVTLTTDPGCEWTAFTNTPWIMVNGVGQGTGSATISYTVAQNLSTTNRIGTIFIASQAFTVFQGANFNDVPTTHPFYEAIGKLSAHGITLGCGGGNFCPNNFVSRQDMAAFIIRSLGDFNPDPPASQRFNDVPPDNPFYAFIEQMAVRGITQGCGGGNYCPTDLVKRQEMAAFIVRALGETNPPVPATQRFADVPPDNPFYAFIDRLFVLGITQGCGFDDQGRRYFCPTDPVTRAQMAAFLVRAFNL